MPRAVPVLLCLLALLASACGEEERDEASLLSRTEAQRLDERVSRIGQLAGEGRCEAARDNLEDYAFRVEQLSERRDPELRDRLREGATNLERTLESECAPEEEPSTTETTTTEEPEPEPEPEPAPTEEPEPVPTTDEVPAPAPTPVPGEDGEGGAGDEGVPPGQGGTPPGQGGTPPGQVPDGAGGVQAPGGDG